MTTVDTNVLVRIMVRDDSRQAARASAFLDREERIFVPKTVVLELEWVLRSAYKVRRADILSGIRSFLAVNNVEVEDGLAVAEALHWYEQGLDFAESLHIASAGRDTTFATFDTELQRMARRFDICKVIAL
jgi:predicted nucleic-acid-binding protein